MVVDPYVVLGVGVDADQDDIRRAWVDLAHRHHPDHGGDPAEMQAISEAWAVLGDPDRRRAWDREHRSHRGTPPQEPPVDLPEDPAWLDPTPLFPPRRSSMDLVPALLFVSAIATGCVALVLDEPALLGLAGFLFFLSCLAVVAAAMLSMRRSVRAGRR